MDLIITTVIWAALIQGLLLGILFIFSRKHRSLANRLLGLFLITFVFEALNTLLPFEYIGTYSLSGAFTLPEVKLFFPIFFMHFVLEKIGRSSVYRPVLTVHYCLAVGIMSITLINVFVFLVSGNSLIHYLGWEPIEQFFLGQQFYAFVLTIGAFILVVRETLQYREVVRNEYSDFALLEINWLWQFIFVLLPIIAIWGAELLRVVLGGRGQSDMVIITWVLIAGFIYFVSYKAFIHQNLFDGPRMTRLKSEGVSSGKEKRRSTINQKACETIRSRMESGTYYLDQDLTIHDFAKEIDISSRLISSCINQTLDLNFNEWVNSYRVDKAILLLQDKESKHFSIEGIGSEAGFKSRSAMYMAFKKKTGESPGYFRRV